MKAVSVARPRLMRQPTASNACTLGLASELAALVEIEDVWSRGHAQDIGQLSRPAPAIPYPGEV